MILPSFDSRYAFITGAVRALETDLLRSNDIEQLTDTGTIDNALEMLSRIAPSYAADTVLFAKQRSFPQRRESMFRSIEACAPQVEVAYFFRVPHDYSNLKALLRDKIFNPQGEPDLSDSGTIPPDTVRDIIGNEQYDILPPPMRYAVIDAVYRYYESPHPVTIDLVLDRALTEELRSAISILQSPFLEQYFTLFIDLTNIHIHLRAAATLRDPALRELLYLPGGALPPDIPDSSGELAAALEKADRPDLAGAVMEYSENPGAIDREIDNALTQHLRATLYHICGVEPLFAYCYAVMLEMKILRTVLCGIESGMDAHEIRRTLPEPFFGYTP